MMLNPFRKLNVKLVFLQLDNVVMKGNASLRSLSNWFFANKLSLSVDTTSYIIFLEKC